MMLVESMSRKEIAKEVLNDYNTIVTSSTLERLGYEYYRERNKLHIKKEAEYSRYYDLKTKSKNKWTLILYKADDLKKIQKIEDCSFLLYTFYYTGKNICVVRIAHNDMLEFYYGHLFARYRERMSLDMPNLMDVVKYYMKISSISWNRKLPEEDGQIKVIATLKGGFQLGEYDKENQCDVFKTFIPFETANLLSKSEMKETIYIMKHNLLYCNHLEEESLYHDLSVYLDMIGKEGKG
jgi:hypothetical protein